MSVEPPIRWAGSKRALVHTLLEAAPEDYKRYIEPFAGSACLFFALRPEKSLLADFNHDLISMYRALRADCETVVDELEKLDSDGEDYYRVRDQYNSRSDDGKIRAAQFLYLNRFGFNGVYRTNRAGSYNVPRGSRTGTLSTRAEFRRVASALQQVDLLCQDFRDTVRAADEGDLLYVDPPYATTRRSTYGEYGYGAFGSMEDLSDLESELHAATARGVKIILSFGESSNISSLLEDWRVRFFTSHRRISASVESRSTTYQELIATNFDRGV